MTIMRKYSSGKVIYFLLDFAFGFLAVLAFFDLVVFLPELHPHVRHIF